MIKKRFFEPKLKISDSLELSLIFPRAGETRGRKTEIEIEEKREQDINISRVFSWKTRAPKEELTYSRICVIRNSGIMLCEFNKVLIGSLAGKKIRGGAVDGRVSGEGGNRTCKKRGGQWPRRCARCRMITSSVDSLNLLLTCTLIKYDRDGVSCNSDEKSIRFCAVPRTWHLAKRMSSDPACGGGELCRETDSLRRDPRTVHEERSSGTEFPSTWLNRFIFIFLIVSRDKYQKPVPLYQIISISRSFAYIRNTYVRAALSPNPLLSYLNPLSQQFDEYISENQPKSYSHLATNDLKWSGRLISSIHSVHKMS